MWHQLFEFQISSWLSVGLSLCSMLLNVGLMVYAWRRLPESRVQRSFHLFSASLFVWQTADLLMRLSASRQTASLWFDLLSFGVFFTPALLLYLVLQLLERRELLRPLAFRIVLFGPPLFLTIITRHSLLHFPLAYDAVWGWDVKSYDNFPMLFLGIWSCVISLTILFQFRSSLTQHRAHPKQYTRLLWLTVGFLLPAIQGVLTQFLIPLFYRWIFVPVVSSMFLCFSYSAICYIRGYNPLKEIPAEIAETVLATVNAMVLVSDHKGRILYANQSALQSLPFSNRYLGHVTFRDILPEEEDYERLKSSFTPVLEHGQALENQRATLLTREGTPFPVEIRCYRLLIPQTQRYGMLWVGRDRSREREQNSALERMATALEYAGDAIEITDLQHRYIYVNPAFESLTGYDKDEILGRKPKDVLRSHEHSPEFYAKQEATLKNGQVWAGEYSSRRKNGETFIQEATLSPVFDEDGQLQSFVGVKRDITQRRHQEDELRYHALHDPLTGLANRALLKKFVNNAQQRLARQSDYCFALLFLDLDKFKELNDTLGHHCGDQMLICVAEKLRHCVRSVDTVARLGGDEFVVLMDNITDMDDAIRLAERIHQSLSQEVTLDGKSCRTSTSIGIALGHKGHTTPESLIQDADAAMYQAKAEGRSRSVLFDPLAFHRSKSTAPI